MNWTEMTCTKLTQLHDALLVTRVSVTKLIGCRAAVHALRYSSVQFVRCVLEVCMGVGKTGIPWVPWDSHRNGNKISHGMGMGWEWELSAWEWELRRGSCRQQL